MKKIAIISLTLGFVVSLFGQGTIGFSTKSGAAYTTVAPGAVFAPVFLPEPGSEFTPKTGAAPYATSFFAPGTVATAYRASGVYSGTGVWAAGTGFTAQLWAGVANSDESGVTNLVASATMRTQTTTLLGGTVNYTGATPTVPGVPGGQQAAFQLRVWDNRNNTITSWAQVNQEANNNVLRGASPVFTGPYALTVPPATAVNLQGLTSFSLYQVIPEPSVVALGILGIGALVLFRRRKN